MTSGTIEGRPRAQGGCGSGNRRANPGAEIEPATSWIWATRATVAVPSISAKKARCHDTIALAVNGAGRWNEWHLGFAKVFCHLAFNFAAWTCQPAVMTAPPLFHARFATIRSVSDSMSGDGIEEVLIRAQALCGVTVGAKLGQRLESFQGLHGSLEADGPRQNIVFCRSLGHDGADDPPASGERNRVKG